jgi:hypothetical protein
MGMIVFREDSWGPSSEEWHKDVELDAEYQIEYIIHLFQEFLIAITYDNITAARAYHNSVIKPLITVRYE